MPCVDLVGGFHPRRQLLFSSATPRLVLQHPHLLTSPSLYLHHIIYRQAQTLYWLIMPPGGESLEVGNEGARGGGGGGAVSRTPGSGKGKEKATSGGGGGGDGYVVVYRCGIWLFLRKGISANVPYKENDRRNAPTPILMSTTSSPSHSFRLSVPTPSQSYSAQQPPAPKPFVSVLSLPVHEGFVAWLASPDR